MEEPAPFASGQRLIRSTTDVAAKDASEYWSEAVCRTLVEVAARPASDDFSGRIEHFSVDDIGFSLVSSGPQQVERTRMLVARSEQDYAMVNIQITGKGYVTQDDRAAVLAQGSMTFIDSTRPYSLSFEDTFSQLIVQVPQRLLPRRALAEVTSLELAPEGPGRLIADFLTGMERQQRIDPQAVASLMPHAVALLESALSLVTRTRPERPNAALTRERVRQFIHRHAQEPRLNVDMVAAGCGLSHRTMFRALSDGGETFTSLLRRARVTRVQQLLRTAPDRTLAVVAQQCGFAGEAQMYRAFRAVTGTTPAAYRARTGKH